MTPTKLWATCSLLLLPGLLSAGAAANRNGHYVRLKVDRAKPGAIRLEAKQASWEQVFDELARTTGARIHYPVPLAGTITATCAGTTFKQIMECLLTPEADFILRFPGGSQQAGPMDIPAEIWVLQSSFGMSNATAFGKKNAGICAHPDSAAGTGQCRHLQIPQVQSEAAQLLASAHALDPAVRADAIARLATEGGADDTAVKEALGSALLDENPEVRAQAVFGLAHREGAEAAAVLQEAMHDSDASVRLMAVDSAGENAALLQDALSDNDETVRALAAMKLETLSQRHQEQ